MPIMPNRSSCARPHKHHVLIGGLLALACLCSAPAQAAKGGAESREALASKARKACLAGDIQTGMGILSELFVATKDPTYIYNQGRCFEQNGKYEEAVSRFEEFLRLTKERQPGQGRGRGAPDRVPGQAGQDVDHCPASRSAAGDRATAANPKAGGPPR